MTDTIEYTGHRHGVDVALGDLKVDLAVQRLTVPSRLRKLTANFNPALVGELLVSEREDGLFVLDGHHRLESAKRLNGNAPASMSCEIFTGLSRADEARLFLGRNDRASVRSHDRFRNLYTLGDEETLNVRMAAQAAGYVFISEDVKDATFLDRAAGVTIMKAAENRKNFEASGVEHLSHVLKFYARAYGNQDRPESLILKAISKIFLKFDSVDEDRLYNQLRGIPPQQVVHSAEQHYLNEEAVRSLSRVTAAIEVVTEQYNRGLATSSDKRIKV